MKLLIFRQVDIDLFSQDEHPPNYNLCPSTSAIYGVRLHVLSAHHHSIWLHLGYQYAIFQECDCIYVETEPQNSRKPVPDLQWRNALKCLRIMA